MEYQVQGLTKISILLQKMWTMLLIVFEYLFANKFLFFVAHAVFF